MDTTTGYWAHSIQKLLVILMPQWIRIKISFILNKNLREDYFKQEERRKEK